MRYFLDTYLRLADKNQAKYWTISLRGTLSKDYSTESLVLFSLQKYQYEVLTSFFQRDQCAATVGVRKYFINISVKNSNRNKIVFNICSLLIFLS